ncbi:type II and III secretion system protein family protein [Vampirovibrio sp.]|uniref:type II and III secretion system protein family protein n=1 Tax=Vampirovibrio sp. TaxID=2717857 RepID=UPI0035932471
MNGRTEKRLITLALAVAVMAQVFPVMVPVGHGGFSFASDERKSAEPMALKPRVKFPEESLKPVVAPALMAKPEKPAFVLQQLDESDAFSGSSGNASKTKALQGSVTSIHVTRGRSQIVKFAQPIMRLSIAEPTVADVIPLSPDQIMINGKLRGVTSLIVWDENGQEGIFDLYVQNDSSELLDTVNALAPNEKIQARVTDDSFILSGQVSSSVVLDEIRKTVSAYGYRDDKFIDLTDTPVPQVVLEVRIAEANRSVGRQLKSAYQVQSATRDLSIVRLANPLDNAFLNGIQRATSGLLPNAFGPVRVNQAGSNTGGLTGSFNPLRNVSVMWDLLETSGKVNTLANPTLVCTHGRTASFLAGGEFPFVGSVDQNGSPIIQYKEFGVKLNFTPWIAIKSGRIELKVAPEVSNLDSSSCVAGAAGSQVCGILKRSTDTTVELMDGETLMISGILTREEQNTFNKVPFIGNVPILGNMFKNANMSKNDRELVVVITPHIVKAADYGKVLGAAQ